MHKRFIVVSFVICSACTLDSKNIIQDSAPEYVPFNVMQVPDAVPIYEKRTRAGNPPKYEVLGKQYKILSESKGYQEKGIASWYGVKFHGKKTSNGEVYDMFAMTAAHKTLPIPSYVRVTNMENLRSIVVRINDRGPFHDNRIIDLSYTAAKQLGIQQKGTGFVEVIAIEPKILESVNQEQSTKADFQYQAETELYLQIGVFSNQSNARLVQQKLLRGQITKSRIKLAQNQTNILYKVQVGPLFSFRQADEVNEKLGYLGFTDIQLVDESRE